MKRFFIALLSLTLVSAPAFAQQRTITGKVTSEQGSPLSSVSVAVKGTSLSTPQTVRAITRSRRKRARCSNSG